MAHFEFVTTWRIEAPIERVYDAIADPLAWPTWWDSVLTVEELEPGDADGTGGVRRYVFKGRLPYLVRFDLTTDSVDRPTRLGARADGELIGRGDWSFRADGDATLVRYDWRIRTTRAWMNALAPLPFVRAIFVLNHDHVMRRGLIGLRRQLGVAGSELPNDTLPAPTPV